MPSLSREIIAGKNEKMTRSLTLTLQKMPITTYLQLWLRTRGPRTPKGDVESSIPAPHGHEELLVGLQITGHKIKKHDFIRNFERKQCIASVAGHKVRMRPFG